MSRKCGKNTIPLTSKCGSEEIPIENKIPLGKCKELLGEKGAKYTDEQVLLIRDWFYKLVAITYNEYFVNQEQRDIVPITVVKNNDDEERLYLRAG
jgi:hypothetical protein